MRGEFRILVFVCPACGSNVFANTVGDVQITDDDAVVELARRYAMSTDQVFPVKANASYTPIELSVSHTCPPPF